jgi:hypothetical protein
VFPMLTDAERPTERALLGSRFDRAKASAPTHPHPHLRGSAPWNQVLGPIAALVDRARDAVTARAAADRAPAAPEAPTGDPTTRRPAASRRGPTRQDLYEEARRRGIPGRSKMTKGELEAALHNA